MPIFTSSSLEASDMTDANDTGDAAGTGVEVPEEVVAAARVGADSAQADAGRPAWVDAYTWQALWKVVAVALTTAALLVIAWRVQHLLRVLALSVFFALAIIPAVKYIHERWGWKRGAAVGAIYAATLVFLVLMVVVLIPGIANFAGEVSANGDTWVNSANSWAQDTFGTTLIDEGSGSTAASDADSALAGWADNILGFASSGIGLIFDLATMALFTFYFAADAPRIQRALLSRMPPHRQQVAGWVWDTAITQTGGYFYSRMLLVVINGGLFFVAMLLVGMPLVYALPLSVFEGFVAEFIPAIGTYLGAAVPILISLVVAGLGAAVILLVWVLIYQQLENYWLSPRISAQTMEINGGVAFGAALAGGAIAGPMGAFVSLPFAALITSIVKNSSRTTYRVVYQSKYASPQADTPTGQDAAPSPAMADAEDQVTIAT